MSEEDFRNIVTKKAQTIGISINDKQMQELYIYTKILLEWNEKINITAITVPEEIINKHYIDSIIISKFIKDSSKIIDIGTGGGFPGIPLKIINSTLDITLLDSLNKRVNFLQEVINILKLSNILAIHGRAEEVGQQKEYREKYDIAVSRAVAPLNILLEYMLPYVKVGGICICMKGPNISEELENSQKAIQILGGKLETTESMILPETDITRNNIIIKKIKPTPNLYPRKAGMPSKNPIE